MRNVRNKVPPHSFEVFESGDIMEHHYQTVKGMPRSGRRNLRFEGLAHRRQHLERHFNVYAFIGAFFQSAQKPGLPEQLER